MPDSHPTTAEDQARVEKFTRGPWHKNQSTTRDPAVYSAEGYLLADCFGHQRIPQAEEHANAHLIASAPDMYAALNDAYKVLIGWPGTAEWRASVTEDIKAALAKAVAHE